MLIYKVPSFGDKEVQKGVCMTETKQIEKRSKKKKESVSDYLQEVLEYKKKALGFGMRNSVESRSH